MTSQKYIFMKLWGWFAYLVLLTHSHAFKCVLDHSVTNTPLSDGHPQWQLLQNARNWQKGAKPFNLLSWFFDS